MQITSGQAHDIVAALSSLEDHEIKLSGETILYMAISLNKLRYIAAAYEQARTRMLADIVKESQSSGAANQVTEATFVEAEAKLRETEHEVDIKTIDINSLDLANNPKIRPVTIARLMPILTGV